MKASRGGSTRQNSGNAAGGLAATRKAWFDESTRILVSQAQERAQKAKAKGGKGDDKKEARQRSSQLSTSSDTVGVSFAGAAFQADYFASKFTKRGQLVYTILSDLIAKSRYVLPPSTSTVSVASFGGGPGTDAAGIVWIQREFFPHTTVHCTLYDYETSWKRYAKSLDDVFGDAVSVSFAPCDVTHPIDSEPNRRVTELEVVDIFLFCFVCHETSARQRNLQFYLDLASLAKPGALVVLADVKTKSKDCLEQVAETMASVRPLVRLQLSKAPTAEAVVFQFA